MNGFTQPLTTDDAHQIPNVYVTQVFPTPCLCVLWTTHVEFLVFGVIFCISVCKKRGYVDIGDKGIKWFLWFFELKNLLISLIPLSPVLTLFLVADALGLIAFFRFSCLLAHSPLSRSSRYPVKYAPKSEQTTQ